MVKVPPITDVIKSTDTPRNPIAGGEYWYSIVLRAKERDMYFLIM